MKGIIQKGKRKDCRRGGSHTGCLPNVSPQFVTQNRDVDSHNLQSFFVRLLEQTILIKV